MKSRMKGIVVVEDNYVEYSFVYMLHLEPTYARNESMMNMKSN
jgi:hypothetical protein